MRGSCQLLAEYVHEELVNHLDLSLPRKSVVSLTDDITIDVYRGRKTTIRTVGPGKTQISLPGVQEIFFLFLNENLYCDPSLEPFSLRGSTKGLYIGFYGERSLIISELSLKPLICSSVHIIYL